MCVFTCLWFSGVRMSKLEVGGLGLEDREIQPVPFPLLPHYKNLGFPEHTNELQRVFHLKIEQMS